MYPISLALFSKPLYNLAIPTSLFIGPHLPPLCSSHIRHSQFLEHLHAALPLFLLIPRPGMHSCLLHVVRSGSSFMAQVKSHLLSSAFLNLGRTHHFLLWSPQRLALKWQLSHIIIICTFLSFSLHRQLLKRKNHILFICFFL